VSLARRALLALLLAALAAVAVARAAGLARAAAGGETEAARLARTARNETRWYAWAERHPRMSAAVAEVAPRVPAGSRVLWVVPPSVDRRWLEIVVLYRLPAASPAAVVRRGDEPPAVDADLRVDLYGDGRAAVSPLPASGSASGGGGSSAPGRR